jgi:hypothetical protein
MARTAQGHPQRLALTLDQDWAPDWAVRRTAELLVERRVKATWFVTNDSPSLAYLRRHADLFELGIHPNFAAGSTQGVTPSEILARCMETVPEAKVMRAHGLLMSSSLYISVMRETPLTADVTTFMPGAPSLRPALLSWGDRSLWKVPFYWEDDVEFSQAPPCWELRGHLRDEAGLAIFNFHPIHICLDTRSEAHYAAYRRAPELEPPAEDGRPGGVRALFDQLLDALEGGGATVSELLGQTTNLRGREHA